jgi:protein tyrosine/serine phosphatase
VDYKKFGFEQVLKIPMRSDPPSDLQAEEFLRFIQDPNHQPVHIHCTAGRSRTGMMAALARYSIDGWPMEKALAEARAYRGGEDLAAIRVAWLKDWAAKHQPGSYRTKQ